MRGMARLIAAGNDVSLRSDEYVVLDGDHFLKWSVRRTQVELPDPEQTSGFAYEVVRALQVRIRSYSDYRLLQQLA